MGVIKCRFRSTTHSHSTMLVGLVLALLSVLANAHYHAVESEVGCTCEPGARAFQSYHIHVMFYPDLKDDQGNPVDEFSNNTHSSKHARSVRKAFIEHFDVPECPTDAKSIFNLTKLCAFAVDEEGTGGLRNTAPFVAPNFAFYVPVVRYSDTVPWMMANRGDLDFIVHPNSCGFTCSPKDHLLWSVWGGKQMACEVSMISTLNALLPTVYNSHC